MNRVQIPAYTDRWMMGDRYGEIVKVIQRPLPGLNLRQKRRRNGPSLVQEIATVKLDKSGKTVRVVLADCEVL